MPRFGAGGATTAGLRILLSPSSVPPTPNLEPRGEWSASALLNSSGDEKPRCWGVAPSDVGAGAGEGLNNRGAPVVVLSAMATWGRGRGRGAAAEDTLELKYAVGAVL